MSNTGRLRHLCDRVCTNLYKKMGVPTTFINKEVGEALLSRQIRKLINHYQVIIYQMTRYLSEAHF